MTPSLGRLGRGPCEAAERPRRKRLRLAEFDYSEPGLLYFATLRADSRRAPFAIAALAQAVVAALLHERETGRALIHAYVLMPDHLHVVLSLGDAGTALPALMAAFKSYTTGLSWRFGCSGRLWQRSYYEHIVRRAEEARTVCEYILGNPVRSGLTKQVGDWPYAGLPDELPI